MRVSTKNRIRHFITFFNRVSKFVAKLFGVICKFNDGENVCLYLTLQGIFKWFLFT